MACASWVKGGREGRSGEGLGTVSGSLVFFSGRSIRLLEGGGDSSVLQAIGYGVRGCCCQRMVYSDSVLWVHGAAGVFFSSFVSMLIPPSV